MARLSYPYISTLLLGDRYPTTAQLILAQDEKVEADFKTAKKKFIEQGAPDDQVKEYFEQFKALKPRIQDAEQRDIDSWAKQGWEKFQVFVDELKGTKSKNQIKKQEKSEGAELIAENDDWKVYKITSHEASKRYGSNTKWCITQDEDTHWASYAKKYNFYFIISKKKRESPWNKIALMVDTDGKETFWDETDKDHGPGDLPADISYTIPDFDAEPATTKIIVDGKLYSLEEFRKRATKDPKFAKVLVVQNVFSRGTKIDNIELGDKDIAVGFYLNDMLNEMPGLRVRDREDLVNVMENHYDPDWSMKDQDVDEFFESIKKAHPKTYAKIQQDLAKVEADTGDEYDRSYRSGAWLSNHEDELQALYNAVSSAIADGWSVGTADAAYKYVEGLVEDFEWENGAHITKGERGLLWLHIPYDNLSDEDGMGLGDLTTDLSRRRDGFDSEFSEDVAKERFYEMLSEEKYAVD